MQDGASKSVSPTEPETSLAVVQAFDPGAGAVILEEEIRESVIGTAGAALGELLRYSAEQLWRSLYQTAVVVRGGWARSRVCFLSALKHFASPIFRSPGVLGRTYREASLANGRLCS